MTRFFKSVFHTQRQIFIPSNNLVIADLKKIIPTKFICIFVVYLHTNFMFVDIISRY